MAAVRSKETASLGSIAKLRAMPSPAKVKASQATSSNSKPLSERKISPILDLTRLAGVSPGKEVVTADMAIKRLSSQITNSKFKVEVNGRKDPVPVQALGRDQDSTVALQERA